MKKILITFISLVIIIGFNLQCFAQFTPEKVAERAEWEEFLKTAEITGHEQMSSREAVTNPWKLTLEKDGIIRNSLWKNPEGRKKGFIEGWKWEIAAYRLERQVDTGPAYRHSGRKSGGHGLVHHGVGTGDVRGIPSDQRRNKVIPQDYSCGLQGFVAPLSDREGLPPAHGTVIRGDLNDHGSPAG